MNEEISREALLIYLENLRTLETIIHNSKLTLKTMDKEIDNIKNEFHTKSINKPVLTTLSPHIYNENNENIFVLGKICVGTGIFLAIVFFTGLCLEGGEILPSGYILIATFLIVGVGFIIFGKIKYKKEFESAKIAQEQLIETMKKKYDEKMEKYNTEIRKSKNRLDESINNYENSKKEVSDEIIEIQDTLDKAYSANIIPLVFRNIEGVYFLYDYLSTSNETLSNAFMQCNLEAIKQKLDKVIDLQSENIIKQQQANQIIFEQNQQILEAAQATMNNTAIVAKYAQIAAVNSTLSLKMQSKQLAYQRADFWLNG